VPILGVFGVVKLAGVMLTINRFCCRRRRYAPVQSMSSASGMVGMDRTPSFAPKAFKEPVVRVSERY